MKEVWFIVILISMLLVACTLGRRGFAATLVHLGACGAFGMLALVLIMAGMVLMSPGDGGIVERIAALGFVTLYIGWITALVWGVGGVFLGLLLAGPCALVARLKCREPVFWTICGAIFFGIAVMIIPVTATPSLPVLVGLPAWLFGAGAGYCLNRIWMHFGEPEEEWA